MPRTKGSKNKPKTEEPVKSVADPPKRSRKSVKSTAEIVEEVSNHEKSLAEDKNLSDPDFDYRQIYTPGQTVYYVYVNEMDGTKEVLELQIRTVYARSFVGFEPGSMCHCVGYKERDLVYLQRNHAEDACKAIRVEAKYG